MSSLRTQIKPMIMSINDMSLYGNPASGRAMTENAIPILAKNAITQVVHP